MFPLRGVGRLRRDDECLRDTAPRSAPRRGVHHLAGLEHLRLPEDADARDCEESTQGLTTACMSPAPLAARTGDGDAAGGAVPVAPTVTSVAIACRALPS